LRIVHRKDTGQKKKSTKKKSSSKSPKKKATKKSAPGKNPKRAVLRLEEALLQDVVYPEDSQSFKKYLHIGVICKGIT
jgi:hypothetical protein